MWLMDSFRHIQPGVSPISYFFCQSGESGCFVIARWRKERSTERKYNRWWIPRNKPWANIGSSCSNGQEGKKRSQLAKVLLQSITRKMDRITTCSVAMFYSQQKMEESWASDFPAGRCRPFSSQSIHQLSLIRRWRRIRLEPSFIAAKPCKRDNPPVKLPV